MGGGTGGRDPASTAVTRKITRAIAGIKAGKQQALYLGDLDARRDWGYVTDYVAAMWKILQCDHAADFVIGTGEAHSVRDFLDEAFACVDLDCRDYEGQTPATSARRMVTFSRLIQAEP